ncbi:MAG: hypothetical protein GY810_13330 [Aureispira sp.]|nr:hypothetical protein [Aureispira sp.]
MEILDDLELEGKPQLPKVNVGDYGIYAFILFLMVVGTFTLSSIDLVEPFPLLESPVGLLFCFALFCVTTLFYRKTVTPKPWVLLWGVIGFLVGGFIAAFMVDEMMGIGRSEPILAGVFMWFFYCVGTLILSLIIFGIKRQRA